MGAHESGDDPRTLLRRFLSLHREDIGAVVIYAAAVGILVLATPIAVQTLVSTAAFGTVLQPIAVIALLLLGGLALAGVLGVLKSYAVEVLQRRMFVRTVAALAHRLPRSCPVERLESHAVHRFFDLFGAQKAAATLLLGGVDVVLSTCVGVLVLAFYHPLLLVFDLALLASVALLVLVAGRGGIDSAIDESAQKLALGAFLADVTAQPLAFRTAPGRAFALAQIDALAANYLRARAAHFRIVLRQLGGAVTLSAVASAGLLGLGGFLVIERELTLGQLVAAELIVSAVLASLANLGKYAEVYYDLAASLHKLDRLVHAPCERDEGTGVLADTGPCEVQLDDVRLARGERIVLDTATCRIAPGARVVLSAPAGAGKSSVLDLLYGLARPERGRVLIDGTDVRELSRAALRERVALVRGPALVAASVLENVRMGDARIAPERVRALLTELGLTDELTHLARGLETPINPALGALSDSQAFRLTLARALVRAPGLVLVDADASMLDARTHALVMHVLAAPTAPWTLLFVADPAQQRAREREVLRIDRGRLSLEAIHDAA